ncbi:N-acetyltransferase [Croceivirga lutea]|uniref:GNAT family N-acetyltransferase n=1 Tax=Croceivirga lutea TaxID=1775167 RepID=UPI00163ACCC0|nr:GNAT family N-acetyltransferase [Croceivirga lutea]GGG46997.1 N-acetyltransferase [Croceivirga lutea]
MKNQLTIRPIQIEDNQAMAAVIRGVFDELDVPKTGTAYADPAMEDLFGTYQKDRSAYFVIADDKTVYGGAGIAQLDNFEGDVCELQKMYFSNSIRGKGLGKQLIMLCLETAKQFGFEGCYLETMPYMDAAQILYKKNGFKYIDAPMGCTGHSACPVYMYKDL